MNKSFASWGRLFRLSLSATAIGDVLAGGVLTSSLLASTETSVELWPQLPLLVGASLLVYHGGMAFNDWCDREEDARLRPDRPIPSGAIPAGLALGVALLCFVLGPLLASIVHPMAGVWAAILSFLAALYDYRGRGAWTGPGLLGLCRAMNLALPIVAFGGFQSLQILWPAPVAYGLYVFLLSRLGRLEDGEATASQRQTPVRLLYCLGALFWVLPLLPLPHAVGMGRTIALAIGIAASQGLFAKARGLGDWQPADLIPAMGCALRRMLPFSAALVCLPGTPVGYVTALCILALFPVAVWLRGVFPPS